MPHRAGACCGRMTRGTSTTSSMSRRSIWPTRAVRLLLPPPLWFSVSFHRARLELTGGPLRCAGPVDEVAGTGVTTFVYMVARSDGLFYPSAVGQCWPNPRELPEPYDMAAYWRISSNMKSLAERGLDPLQILIDAAHEGGMEFVASVRLPSYLGLDPAVSYASPLQGGNGMLDSRVLDSHHAILTELATVYDTDGVELDLSSGPGGSAPACRPEDAAKFAPVLTSWIGRVSEVVHGHGRRSAGGRPGLVGVRVFPTADMNSAFGFDVAAWITAGYVDYVVPMLYIHFVLDPNLDIRWLTRLTRAAAATHPSSATHAPSRQCAVYGMLQPYLTSESRGGDRSAADIYPTIQHIRAASANLYEIFGADGVYAYLQRWPHDAATYQLLAEVGRPSHLIGQSKVYSMDEYDHATAVGLREAGLPRYPWQLPLVIPQAVRARVSVCRPPHPHCLLTGSWRASSTSLFRIVRG